MRIRLIGALFLLLTNTVIHPIINTPFLTSSPTLASHSEDIECECAICFNDLERAVDHHHTQEWFYCEKKHPVSFCAECLTRIDIQRQRCPLCNASSKRFYFNEKFNRCINQPITLVCGTVSCTLLGIFFLTYARMQEYSIFS